MAPDNPISRLIGRYIDRYVETVGTKPHIQRPRDPKLLSDLLKQHDEGTVSSAMDAMFEDGDEFVQRHGYSLGIFKGQFNGFLVKSTNGGTRPKKGDAAVRTAYSPAMLERMRKAGVQ